MCCVCYVPCPRAIQFCVRRTCVNRLSDGSCVEIFVKCDRVTERIVTVVGRYALTGPYDSLGYGCNVLFAWVVVALVSPGYSVV